jgi:predicted amidohydrolase
VATTAAIAAGVLLGLGLIWTLWSRSGRQVGDRPAELQIRQILSVGENNGRGNVVGVQPHMTPWDYASEEQFYAKLAGYLEVARRAGWLNEKTILVFPEYIGTWLVAAGEKRAVYLAGTLTKAMQTLVLSNLLPFAQVWLSAGLKAQAEDKVKFSLFRLKASRMADIYQAVFSRLAREFQVTIVAGSIVLPSPRVEQGTLKIGQGPLTNCSLVYRPDGSAYRQVVRKVFPTRDEQPFTAAALLSELPLFETPAGRMALLICADSWYPATYETIRAGAPELVVVPSYLAPDNIWSAPWEGYNGAPAPGDVDIRDVGRLTEGEAWLKYGLAGRLMSSGARWGMNVFLRGRIWDLGSDGRTVVVHGGQVTTAQRVQGAVLTNLWLNTSDILIRSIP